MTDATFVTQNRTEPVAVPVHPSDKQGLRQGKAADIDFTFGLYDRRNKWIIRSVFTQVLYYTARTALWRYFTFYLRRL
jgi:hypothetical protein